MLQRMTLRPDGDEPSAARDADEALTVHDRVAWAGYAVIFLVIPMVVLVFRLHMQPWHYYLAGALFLAGALLIEAMNIAAMARRDDEREPRS